MHIYSFPERILYPSPFIQRDVRGPRILTIPKDGNIKVQSNSKNSLQKLFGNTKQQNKVRFVLPLTVERIYRYVENNVLLKAIYLIAFISVFFCNPHKF